MRLIALPASGLVLAALLLVAGCAAAPGDSQATPDGSDGDAPTASCTPLASGAASDSIVVAALDPTAPTASFTAPLSVAETQRTIVTAGDGELVEPGVVAVLDISVFNGATGTAGITEQSLRLPVDERQTLPGFVKAVECARVGDRVAAVLAPADAFGDTGSAQVGIGAGEPVVLIVDILGIDLYYPLTEPGEWRDAPEVDFSAAPPAFELEGDPATELLAHTIEAGSGDVVRYGQTVTVNYVGRNWDTGEVFDESYSSAPRSFSTAGVVQGFGSAIVGHTVGSTVIVTMPPEYGYGQPTGAATDHALAGQTLVFVVEILEVVG